METPSSVMYADLKDFGRISNHEAALVLLSPDVPYGGTPMRLRASGDRSFLSRDVVHALPGQIPAEQFSNLDTASLYLGREIVRRLGANASAVASLERHYAGPAGRSMVDALAAFSIDGTLFDNARGRIAQCAYTSPQTKGDLLLMLFVATGCLGDPVSAVRLVYSFAESTLSQGLCTAETEVGQGFDEEVEAPRQDVRLGLLRLVDGAVRGSVLPLSTAPQGTTIGALVSGPNGINAVGMDVSRRHLRVWRAPDGIWYARGLGSTNGTTLISGDTHERICVEPPRSERTPGAEYPPVLLSNSDILCLGASTRFLVMRVPT